MLPQVLGVDEAVARSVTGAEAERAGREAEREGGPEAEGAHAPRLHRGQHRPEHHHGAGGEQRDRGEVAGPAEEHEDAVGHRLAHLSAGPAEVEDACEEGGERHEPQADQVPLALIERRQLDAAAESPCRAAALACFGPA